MVDSVAKSQGVEAGVAMVAIAVVFMEMVVDLEGNQVTSKTLEAVSTHPLVVVEETDLRSTMNTTKGQSLHHHADRPRPHLLQADGKLQREPRPRNPNHQKRNRKSTYFRSTTLFLPQLLFLRQQHHTR